MFKIQLKISTTSTLLLTSVVAPLSVSAAGALSSDSYSKLETANLLLAKQDKLAIASPPFTHIKPINNGASEALVAGPGISIIDDVQNAIKIATSFSSVIEAPLFVENNVLKVFAAPSRCPI